ncbi:MAG: hypothetical protein A2085_08425 [Gemmatimonadetes bacterium GWC2_71_10]|nr:MAG: hypothetical protein A2085_08425 [Gemmatimonadetes bacterium GWC2_71_10]
MRLGIISDPHGLLRPQVHEIFKQVDRILHAGDVGGEGTDILDELALIAPVTAVYGNVDGALRGRLNGTAEEMIDGFRFVITHGHELGARVTPEHLKERFGDADVIVFGHTHKAVIRDFPDFSVAINPGSAGPRRFKDPVTVAIMETEPGIPPRARIVPIV